MAAVPQEHQPRVTGSSAEPGADRPALPGADGDQTGHNVCPTCGGEGTVAGGTCTTCGGGGVVAEPVGDA